MNYAPPEGESLDRARQIKGAIVLINLGTPDAPTVGAIRQYLREFLSDRRVVNLPRWLWLPVLHLFILRLRPRKLVGKYQMIWGTKDGPIRNITLALARRLEARLRHLGEDLVVEAAMTYGKPSISNLLDRFIAAGVQHITFLSLFPQYAGATFGAAQDAIHQALSRRGISSQGLSSQDLPSQDLSSRESTPQERPPSITILKSYHTHPAYITALAESIKKAAAYRQGSPRIVFSFHSIPVAQAEAGDPYAEECRATARLVVAELGLPEERWMLTWQSRFGPARWLEPATLDTMRELPKRGVKDVLVVCPGFAVDCLETIEEIKQLNKDVFLSAGGEKFNYVKALNATPAHVEVMMALLRHTREGRAPVPRHLKKDNG